VPLKFDYFAYRTVFSKTQSGLSAHCGKSVQAAMQPPRWADAEHVLLMQRL
jgi:hypothetical protein